ncbi:MAG: F0F1 ATP synthase subunit A, partial [Armatimonadota bacterium]
MHEEHGSWLNAIVHLLPEHVQHHWVDLYVVNSWLIIILLVVLAWLGTRTLRLKPRGLQNLWEMYYGWVCDFCRKEIGPNGEKHAPILATIFVYILFLNLFGLVPGFITPTMSLNMTVPLALVVFLWVQWSGVAALGPVGYLMHFVGDPWWLFPINIPVHIVGEIAKPLSLAIRLFGNMFGEETALVQVAALGAAVFAATYIPLPLHFINVVLHLIIGPIQAFIFFALGAAYIKMATSHEGGSHDEAGAEEHDQAQSVEQAA